MACGPENMESASMEHGSRFPQMLPHSNQLHGVCHTAEDSNFYHVLCYVTELMLQAVRCQHVMLAGMVWEGKVWLLSDRIL